MLSASSRLIIVPLLLVSIITFYAVVARATHNYTVDPAESIAVALPIQYSFGHGNINNIGYGVRNVRSNTGTYDLVMLGPNIQLGTEALENLGLALRTNGGSFLAEFQTRTISCNPPTVTTGCFNNAYTNTAASPAPFSLVFILRFATLPTQDYLLLEHGIDVAPDRGWRLRFVQSTGRLAFDTSPNGTTAYANAVTSTAALSVNTWYMIVVRYDGVSAASISLNGGTAVSGAVPLSVINSPARPLYVLGSIPSEFADTLLDELYLFNGLLSAANITTLAALAIPDADDYQFRVDVQINNAGLTNFTDIQIPIEMSTATFINSNYTNSILSSLLGLSTSAAALDFLAASALVSQEDTTYFYTTVPELPSEAVTQVSFYMGLDTNVPLAREQPFTFNTLTGEDVITVLDSSQLDITNNLGIAFDAELLTTSSFAAPAASVVIYQFEEGSGLPQDQSGNANHFTSCNIPSSTSVPTITRWWNSFSLAAATSTQTCIFTNAADSSTQFTRGEEISISTWIYSPASAAERTIIVKEHTTDDNLLGQYQWRLAIDTDDLPFFDFYDSTGQQHKYKVTGQVVPDNTWTHLAFSYTFGTGSTAVFYINCDDPVNSRTINTTVIASSCVAVTASWTIGTGTFTSPTVPLVTTGALIILNDYSDTAGWLGRIDDLLVVKDIETQAEFANYRKFEYPGTGYAWLVDKWINNTGYAVGYSSGAQITVLLEDQPLFTATPTQTTNVFGVTKVGTVLNVYQGSRILSTTTTAATLTANTKNLVAGENLNANVYELNVRSNQNQPTEDFADNDVLWLRFTPNQFRTYQAGAASNNYVWLGTTTDSATPVQSVFYEIVADLSNITITVQPLIVLAEEEIPNEPLVVSGFFGDLPVIPLTPTPVSVNLPFRDLINDTADQVGMAQASLWYLLAYITALMLSIVAIKTYDSGFMAIIMINLIILGGAMSNMYAYWLVGFTFVLTFGPYCADSLRKGGQL